MNVTTDPSRVRFKEIVRVRWRGTADVYRPAGSTVRRWDSTRQSP
jgi:hypothetical protein